MRVLVSVAVAAAVLAAGSAAAQVPLNPGDKGGVAQILTWTPEQQATGYRTIEKIFKTHTIKRGRRCIRCRWRRSQIDPTFTYQGKTWTTDEYMKAYKVSGILVLKDGQIVLEKYGLGRRNTDRWTSFSVAKSVTSTLVARRSRTARSRA